MEHEEIQERWIFAHKIDNENEVRNSAQLCYHAQKIANVLNNSINTIETLEESPYFNRLTKLGRNHQTYGVRPNDFVVSFKNIFINLTFNNMNTTF